MKPKLDDTLRQVAEDTFASLAFMIPMEADDGTAADGPLDLRLATVDFSGPFNGRLTVGVAPPLVPLLAASMLGLEADQAPTAIQQDDALKELTNVICGNLLPIVGSPADVFNVSEPRLTLADGPKTCPQGMTQAAEASLSLDAGYADLTLFVTAACPVPYAIGKA